MTAPFNDRIDQYAAAGGETLFTYTFQITAVIAPDLHGLTVETLTGTVIATLTEGIDYTITGAGNPGGGTIVLDIGVFPAGAIAGVGWTIYSSTPVSRVTDFQTAGDFFAAEVNDQMDDQIHILQDHDRDLGLALKLQLTGALTDITFPPPGANEFVRWNSLGTLLETSPFVTIGGAIGVDETSSDPVKDKLVSDLLAKDWEDAKDDYNADWKDKLTTKGDLLVFSTLNARLAVGTEGQDFTPDTAETPGVIWRNKALTLPKASGYTVVTADQAKFLPLSGASHTITLPSAAAVGDGFSIGFKHTGTEGTQEYTIDGDGSETIDGAVTYILKYTNEILWIVSDGTNWEITHRSHKPGDWIEHDRQTASASATLDVIDITSVSDEWRIRGFNFLPTVDDSELWLRVSEDNGSTFKSAGTDYDTQMFGAIGATPTPEVVTASAIHLTVSTATNSQSNGAQDFLTLDLKLDFPAGAVLGKRFSGSVQYIQASTSTLTQLDGSGSYVGAVNAINAFQLLYDTSTIASGILVVEKKVK